MWSIGIFGICIDIAIDVIEKANMESLNDIKLSNLIFTDVLPLSSLFNLYSTKSLSYILSI